MQPIIKKLFFFGTLLFLGQGVLMADGVSPKAYEIYHLPILNLPITNSMVTSWVFSALLILVVRFAIGRRPTLIPSKGQAMVESVVVGIKDIIEPIVGRHMVKPTFPLLVGLFTFILIHNWSGLLPGVSAFGIYDEQGHFLYFFRSGNADLNMTLALAIVSFVAWIYFVFRYAGPKTVFYDIFGNKAEKSDVPGALYYLLFVVFFAVGIIEVISILLRLISLSFRLFGNVFGGENLLDKVTGMFGYLLPVPFYFLEVLIGLIQAFVFTLLTAIYIGLICAHSEEEYH